MRRILLCVFFVLCAVGRAAFSNVPETIDISWMVGDNIYSQSTCEYGGDVILPDAPTKRGHTFIGWRRNYVELEYLESTGTQAIDTGYVFSGYNNEVVIKFELLEIPSLTDACLTGAEDNGNNWAFVSRVAKGAEVLTVLQHPNVSHKPTIRVFPGLIYVLKMSQNDNNYLAEISEQIYSVVNKQSSYTTTSFALFADKYNTGEYTQMIEARIYYVQIYSDTTLVRDFIPVLDLSGVPCMYDRVTKEYFYNQGTGQFIAGPIKS